MSEEETEFVEEIEEEAAPPPPPPGPGERLRIAREASGMTLEQVAAETRIPQRHLKLIEAGNFAALPARTYAIGFSKNFARAVGLDEEEIGEDVRAELSELSAVQPRRIETFEPGDPARVPGGNVTWIAAGAVLALLVIGYFGYNSLFAPAAELPSLLPEDQPKQRTVQARPGAALVNANGPVVFTALEPNVWVKFYDANGAQLMQKEMALGETYTVPANANGPQLWTGRPDALKITIGGREIPRLATEEQVVKDVSVTAAGLRARTAPTPVPSAAPASLRPATSAAPRAVAPSPAASRPAPAPVESAIAAAATSAPTD
jgi:transcriptional regulator with XRE-family HTH domain